MEDDAPAAKRPRLSGRVVLDSELPDIAGETIEIKIGKGDASETFHVHKTLVCTASKFFANATKPGWQNNETGKPKPIDLSDEEPAIFKVFVQWLYGRIKAMIARTNETGCAADDKAVKIIYAGTPPMSPARRLMVDYWTWAGDVKWLQGRNLIEQISAEFAGDLVLALLEKRKKPGNRTERPWVSQPKSYRLSSQIKEESDTGVEGSAKPEATA